MNKEKINAARAELTEQAQKEGTELATFIEEHINEKLTTDDAAEKVDGKKLSDLIKHITDTARKKAKHNCASISSEEIARMADEFYGLAGVASHHSEAAEKVNVLDLI